MGLLKDTYPLYLNNKAAQPNTDLAVTDKFTGEVAFRTALATPDVIEQAIAGFGKKAKAGTLTAEDMKGGTFTISNGGVFGSLMSTPIINPPQSAVLGLHRIEERAVVKDGQIVARPMMYLALSYDHRLIDGREAVTFLVRIKEAIEDPTRLLIDL